MPPFRGKLGWPLPGTFFDVGAHLQLAAFELIDAFGRFLVERLAFLVDANEVDAFRRGLRIDDETPAQLRTLLESYGDDVLLDEDISALENPIEAVTAGGNGNELPLPLKGLNVFRHVGSIGRQASPCETEQ